MSGIDEIVKAIRQTAEAEAEALIGQARLEAARIQKEAQALSEAENARIADAARAEAAAIRVRAQSEAETNRHRMILTEKQQILHEVLAEALSTLKHLPLDRYFDLMISIAAKSAEKGEGVMYLSRADLARVPEGFEKALQGALPEGATIVLSKISRDIDGGFILQYGDIDRNCSFSALFEDARERLTDAAAKNLFA